MNIDVRKIVTLTRTTNQEISEVEMGLWTGSNFFQSCSTKKVAKSRGGSVQTISNVVGWKRPQSCKLINMSSTVVFAVTTNAANKQLNHNEAGM